MSNLSKRVVRTPLGEIWMIETESAQTGRKDMNDKIIKICEAITKVEPPDGLAPSSILKDGKILIVYNHTVTVIHKDLSQLLTQVSRQRQRASMHGKEVVHVKDMEDWCPKFFDIEDQTEEITRQYHILIRLDRGHEEEQDTATITVRERFDIECEDNTLFDITAGYGWFRIEDNDNTKVQLLLSSPVRRSPPQGENSLGFVDNRGNSSLYDDNHTICLQSDDHRISRPQKQGQRADITKNVAAVSSRIYFRRLIDTPPVTLAAGQMPIDYPTFLVNIWRNVNMRPRRTSHREESGQIFFHSDSLDNHNGSHPSADNHTISPQSDDNRINRPQQRGQRANISKNVVVVSSRICFSHLIDTPPVTLASGQMPIDYPTFLVGIWRNVNMRPRRTSHREESGHIFSQSVDNHNVSPLSANNHHSSPLSADNHHSSPLSANNHHSIPPYNDNHPISPQSDDNHISRPQQRGQRADISKNVAAVSSRICFSRLIDTPPVTLAAGQMPIDYPTFLVNIWRNVNMRPRRTSHREESGQIFFHGDSLDNHNGSHPSADNHTISPQSDDNRINRPQQRGQRANISKNVFVVSSRICFRHLIDAPPVTLASGQMPIDYPTFLVDIWRNVNMHPQRTSHREESGHIFSQSVDNHNVSPLSANNHHSSPPYNDNHTISPQSDDHRISRPQQRGQRANISKNVAAVSSRICFSRLIDTPPVTLAAGQIPIDYPTFLVNIWRNVNMRPRRTSHREESNHSGRLLSDEYIEEEETVLGSSSLIMTRRGAVELFYRTSSLPAEMLLKTQQGGEIQRDILISIDNC